MWAKRKCRWQAGKFLFIAMFYTEESHLHCSQFCLEVKSKVSKVWRLRDLGSVNTFTLETQAWEARDQSME